MKYIVKITLYLFVTTTMLIFGYDAVRFTRDQVRIANIETLSRVIQMYMIIENDLPASGGKENVSQFMYDQGLTDKVVRDPVFTSASVILDQYGFALIKIYDQLMKFSDIEQSEEIITNMKQRIPEIFSDEENNSSENITRLKALIADDEVQNNFNDLKEIMEISDSDVNEFKNILKEANLKGNIDQIRKLASQPIPPDCVIAYQANKKNNTFEISVKLESKLLSGRMKNDGGNDNKRFEIGNNLKLNTAVSAYGKKVRARNRKTSIIR